MEISDEKNLKASSERFHVNEVTRFLGITPRILKHYEGTGVILPDRQDNDYREYTAEDITKLQVAEYLKNVGLTSREIGEYFSGELDIVKARDFLVRQQEKLASLIGIFELDINHGEPQYKIVTPIPKLCYVKTYPYSEDLMEHYYAGRDMYSSAVRAGLTKNGNHFYYYKNCYKEGAFIGMTEYKACIPVIGEAKNLYGGSLERITFGKCFMARMAGVLEDRAVLYKQFIAEAKRRGIVLNGSGWSFSETGPNSKTADRLFTFVVGGEIE